MCVVNLSNICQLIALRSPKHTQWNSVRAYTIQIIICRGVYFLRPSYQQHLYSIVCHSAVQTLKICFPGVMRRPIPMPRKCRKHLSIFGSFGSVKRKRQANWPSSVALHRFSCFLLCVATFARSVEQLPVADRNSGVCGC